MTLTFFSFTQKGVQLVDNLAWNLKEKHQIQSYTLKKYATAISVAMEQETKGYVEQAFESSEALIFIGAAGIAVRLIAPYVSDKFKDPAVISMDERGCYVISLLSGHVGGANQLARKLAELTRGEAVISTATDVNTLFAVDEWAVKQGITTFDRDKAKHIAAALVQGEKVGIASTFEIVDCPKELTRRKDAKNTIQKGIWIGYPLEEEPYEETLTLIPNIIAVGIGCRRGTQAEVIEEAIREMCERYHIPMESIGSISSIDLKKDEQGILAFASKYNVVFRCYTQEELMKVAGDFSSSAFVKSITGVDCVCERAAKAAQQEGSWIARKTVINHVTLAIREAIYKVDLKY